MGWRALICFGAFLLAASGAAGASAPDWLVPLLAEDVTAWKKSESAVRLLDYERVEFVSEERCRRIVRGAVRFSTPAGLARTFAQAGYNADVGRVRGARAWTVSADGKKTVAFARNAFADSVAQYSARFWNSSRVISFSSDKAEVGGVLAWEFTLETESGIFDVSQAFLSGDPLVLGVFEVAPMPGGKLEWFATSSRLGAPVPAGSPGALRWEIRRLEPLANERPAGFYPDPLKISVRCVAPGQTARRARTWEELAGLTAAVIEPKIQVTPEIKAKAESLVIGKTTRWDRIRALAEFCQREIVYLSITQDKDTLAGYRPHAAPEVLRDRFGDCKDKATFLAALLRSVGDQGHVVLVYAGNPRVVPADWPSACFNHAIAAIPADGDTPEGWPTIDGGALGRLVVFDPTHPFVPLGLLPASDQGGFGLLAHASGRLVQLPAETAARSGLQRRIHATVDARGGLSARVEEDYLGSAGATLHTMRQQVGGERFGAVLRDRLHDTLPLARDLKWSDTWEASQARHRVTFSFSTPQHGRVLGGDQLLVSPQIVVERSRLDPWKVEHDGVVWLTAHNARDETRLLAPEDFVVSEMPDEWRGEIAGASSRVRYRQEGREIVVESELTRDARFFEKADYETLRVFLQKARDAARRPVIFLRTAEKKSG